MGQGQARAAPTGLGDHGWIGIDPGHPPLRPGQLGEAAHLMPQATAHVQNLIPPPHRADILHPLLDLLDQRALIGAIEPAEDCLGPTRWPRLLEALMHTAHGWRTSLAIAPPPHPSTTRPACTRGTRKRGRTVAGSDVAIWSQPVPTFGVPADLAAGRPPPGRCGPARRSWCQVVGSYRAAPAR
jgi:hypothetical protein